ncbi:MAG TPA: cupin domain-containing protein [Fimbriimonas sp.]|nr:cupin domain-containing protein [Fimbriimonas sp.]
MRRYRLSDLEFDGPHIFAKIVDGSRLYKAGVSFHRPSHISHDDERPHLEVDQEIFCLLQGSGWIEVDGIREPARAGDVFVVEPGEDHHLISSEDDPFVNLWLHADGPHRQHM